MDVKHVPVDYDPDEELDDLYCPKCKEDWEESLPPYGYKDVTCPNCGQKFEAVWDDFYNDETGDVWEGWILTVID